MMRAILTTLVDLLGLALVTVGLIGFDWRIAAIVVGIILLYLSMVNR